MEYTAGLEAPDIFHFWTAISTIAGALRRHVWIDQGYFQWVPNFYIILVAPPGIVSKTTTISVGSKFLKKVPGVTFGPNAITWQALVQSMAEATEAFPMSDGSMFTQSALTCSAGELGTLIDPHDRVQMDVLTDLWDGRAEQWKKVTKGSGTDIIENPWLNIIAATTPSWLSDNFNESSVGGGFASRCVFVYADKKRSLTAFPKQQMPAFSTRMFDDLLADLEHIATLTGEYLLDPSAIAWGTTWYEEHHKKFSKILPSDRLIGYVARKQTHMMKVAMILAAAQRDELVLYGKDLEIASVITDSIEKSFGVVFSHIGQSEAGKYTQMLVDAVTSGGGLIERTLLMRSVMRVMDHRTFEQALMTGIAAGCLQQMQNGAQMLVKLVRGSV